MLSIWTSMKFLSFGKELDDFYKDLRQVFTASLLGLRLSTADKVGKVHAS